MPDGTRDMLGRKLKRGDIIAYAVREGNVAHMRVYRIDSLSPENVNKAQAVGVRKSFRNDDTFEKMKGISVLFNLKDRAIRLDPKALDDTGAGIALLGSV